MRRETRFPNDQHQKLTARPLVEKEQHQPRHRIIVNSPVDELLQNDLLFPCRNTALWQGIKY